MVHSRSRKSIPVLLNFSKGSIIVNPWNTEDLADSIHDAVSMSDDLRKSNHINLFRYVSKYTASYWGLSFVKELKVCSSGIQVHVGLIAYYRRWAARDL